MEWYRLKHEYPSMDGQKLEDGLAWWELIVVDPIAVFQLIEQFVAIGSEQHVSGIENEVVVVRGGFHSFVQ